MKPSTLAVYSIAFIGVSLCAVPALAECDQLASKIIEKQIEPLVESIDCAVVKKVGVDKRDHKIKSVCYQSSGANSHIQVEAHLHCHASDESVPGKLLGGKNEGSVSEDVTVDAEARGSDCQLQAVHVQPHGELGKALAALFGADGKAKQALQDGLNSICKK